MSPLTCNPWGVLRGKRVKLLIALNMMNTAKRMEKTVQVGSYIIVNNFIFYFRHLAWLNEHKKRILVNYARHKFTIVCFAYALTDSWKGFKSFLPITPHHETNTAVQ